MRIIPSSTYRLQLHKGFTFDDAISAASYIRALGISHVYSSPYLQAAPGSMHGYDVVDHEKVNQELGGEDAHKRFSQRLGELGLGQILDIVPNHMALGRENRYWSDVLENGPSSRYASWFDIDWHSSEAKLQNKVLVPVLGDQYGRILTAGEIRVERDGGRFNVRYGDNFFPVAPRSISIFLAKAAEFAKSDTLNFIADSFMRLPAPESTDRQVSYARHRDKTVIYGLLQRLYQDEPQVIDAIVRALDELNKNYDALDAFLDQQQFRLAYWRTAGQELGYRRFFDVNTLIGLRMERPHVFEATHCKILEWLQSGVLDGVRVDHPDGLRDPQQYCERLRSRAPDAWIVVEKILEPGEFLRENWPIDGTSGYDFLNVCNNLLAHGKGLQELTAVYRDFTHQPISFDQVAHEKKLDVEQQALGSDVNRLTSLFVELCESNRDRRDYTRTEIRRALREVAACFAIYRTYVVPARDEVTEEDRARIDSAVACARERRPDLDSGLFDFLGDVLALRSRGGLETEFLQRFQQFTSPVMAKGVEDTAFYCFNRMIGMNEVGGAPGQNGISIAEFHEYNTKMQTTHPLTMTTLSTHDTKRADDVRARLAVMTEIPARWRAAVNRWSRDNAQFKTDKFPDKNTEYFLYQTLVGAWPIGKDRLIAYMDKATRESKQQTSWTQKNQPFEDALHSFIERILESQQFLSGLEDFVGQVKTAGHMNSLAQTLLKFSAPGVPDTYQGSEIWDLSLVDPDNRRPVDYQLRQRMLNQLQAGMKAEEIMGQMESGLPKLFVTHTALQLRREHPEWFGADAAYSPILAEGAKHDHLVGFSRANCVAAFVPRWTIKLASGWASTNVNLPPGQWLNLFTQEVVAGGQMLVQRLLRDFPVALLIRQED